MAAAAPIPAVVFGAVAFAAGLAVAVALSLVAEQRVVRFATTVVVAVAARQSGDTLLDRSEDAPVALTAALAVSALVLSVAAALSLPSPTASVPALALSVASVVRTVVAVLASALAVLASAAASVLVAAGSRTSRRTGVVRASATVPIRVAAVGSAEVGSGEVVPFAVPPMPVVPVEVTLAPVVPSTVARSGVASLVLAGSPLLVSVGGVAVLVGVALVCGVTVSAALVLAAPTVSASRFVAFAEFCPRPMTALSAFVQSVLVGVVAPLAVSLWIRHSSFPRGNVPRGFP